MIRINDTLALNEDDIQERFVRASGPGGQNVNKVATAVELRLDVNASSLPAEVKQRLIALAGRQVTRDGILMIDSRVHRSQAQNREAAKHRLILLLRAAARRPKTRRRTKPSKAEREKRITAKKSRGEIKRDRRRAADD